MKTRSAVRMVPPLASPAPVPRIKIWLKLAYGTPAWLSLSSRTGLHKSKVSLRRIDWPLPLSLWSLLFGDGLVPVTHSTMPFQSSFQTLEDLLESFRAFWLHLMLVLPPSSRPFKLVISQAIRERTSSTINMEAIHFRVTCSDSLNHSGPSLSWFFAQALLPVPSSWCTPWIRTTAKLLLRRRRSSHSSTWLSVSLRLLVSGVEPWLSPNLLKLWLVSSTSSQQMLSLNTSKSSVLTLLSTTAPPSLSTWSTTPWLPFSTIWSPQPSLEDHTTTFTRLLLPVPLLFQPPSELKSLLEISIKIEAILKRDKSE